VLSTEFTEKKTTIEHHQGEPDITNHDMVLKTKDAEKKKKKEDGEKRAKESTVTKHQLKSQVTKISRSRSPIRCSRVGTEQSRNPRFSRPSDQQSPNRRSSHYDSSDDLIYHDHRIAVGHNVLGDLASDDHQIAAHRILIRLGEISLLVDDDRQFSTKPNHKRKGSSLQRTTIASCVKSTILLMFVIVYGHWGQ